MSRPTSKGFGPIGHSLGGHNAIFTAVMDERIQVVASSYGFDSFLDYYDGEEGIVWYDRQMDLAKLKPVSFERMVRAVEKVRQRLLRAAAALDGAGIPYAVIGGNAVAAWVSRVHESAVRNTQDVDILIRRADFDRVKTALELAGFVHGLTMDVLFLLDGRDAKARDAVLLLMAGENEPWLCARAWRHRGLYRTFGA